MIETKEPLIDTLQPLIDAESPSLDVSISIVNWNTREEVLRCLASIEESDTGTLQIETIVVDNNSEDFTVGAVRRNYPQVRVLTQDANLGFAAGNNRAIAVSSGRYVFVLNPDTELSPDAIRRLVGFADAKPQAGIVGPRVLNPDGSIQHSARAFPTLAAGLFRHSFLGRLFPNNRYTRGYLKSDWDHSDARTVDWVSGAAMLIRREALNDLVGFDEDYFMYVEDVDICWRAAKGGWEVWFCPDATLVHEKAKASDLAPNRMIWQHHRSMYAFFCKHYRPRASIFERIITPIGIFSRAALFIAMNKGRKWLRGAK